MCKLHCVQEQFELDSGTFLHSKVVQRCWDPIKGLAFLHQHRLRRSFRLQVLDFDFDIAVIAGYRGAEGCAAPEVGKGEEGGARLEVQTVPGVRVVV